MKTRTGIEIAVAAFLACSGLWFLVTRPLDDRLDAMLPQEPLLLQSLRIMEDANLSGRVILHIQSVDTNLAHATCAQALDQLAANLPTNIISSVMTPATAIPAPADVEELLTYAPQLLPPRAYDDLAERLTPEGIREALAGIHRTIMSPHAFPMTTWLRRDPLGIRATALRPRERAGKTPGFKTQISQGHFFSEDMQAAILILETPIGPTDHAGSVLLVDTLQEHLNTLPPSLKGTMIAAHLHTLSNQRIIRRDIGRTSLLATIFFGSMFLLFYRDIRSAAIFATPVLGILMGLAMIGFSGMRLAAVVLGMCSMLAGIAIDYAIHVYVALTTSGKNLSCRQAVQRIQRPLWISALTTITPILVLTLSSIPGYRQLGMLATASILFSLLLATRIMPLLFSNHTPTRKPISAAEPPIPTTPSRYILLPFAICLGVAATLASQIKVDLDFTRLSGTEAVILQNEADFFARWGSGPAGMGIVAVWDQDLDTARRANDIIYRHASDPAHIPDAFTSLSPLIPAEKTRQENAARWMAFWEQHASRVKAELASSGRDYDFSETAFDPFWDNLYSGTDSAAFPFHNQLLKMLEKQFSYQEGNRHYLMSFYPDTPENNTVLTDIPPHPAQHILVSRRRLQDAFSTFIVRDLGRQATIALILIALLILGLVRPVRAIPLVLIAPLSGTAGMLAGLHLLGHPLTPITVLAGFLMAGNCFDYGVFMLEAWRCGNHRKVAHAIRLAWLTTAGGASLLLVAQHPVLHATGLALSLGVTCGYVAARWVLWPAARTLRIPTETQEATT